MTPLVDVQAERAVLGAILSGCHVSEVVGLSAEDFGEARHGLIWAAMLALAARGAGIDHVTLSSLLRDKGELAPVGGLAYLMELDQMVPLGQGLQSYVAMVREKAWRRQLVAIAQRYEAAAQDGSQTPARVALEAAQAFSGVRAADCLQRGGKLALRLSERWSDFAEGKTSPFLPLPFDVLAPHFKGFVNNLNVVGGRSGIGKTAFVTECAWHWMEAGIPGAIFGLEDGADWLLERHVARRLGIPYGDVGACRLHEHQQSHLQDVLGQAHALLEKNVFIHEAPAIAFPDLLAEMKEMVRQGARWVVIDHGLRIRYLAPGSRERMDLAIGQAVEAMADFGIRAGVPVILCWHLNRDSEEEALPKRSDFKESGYLDAAARTMLGLWKQGDKRPGHVLCTVVKATKGPDGVTVALEREAPAGLIHAQGGYLVDWRAEMEAQKAEKEVEAQSRKSRTRSRVSDFTGGAA